MRASRPSLLLFLLGSLWDAPTFSQDSPPPLDTDSLAVEVVEEGEEDPSPADFLLGSRPGLEFAPPSTPLLAGNLSATESGTVTSVASAPFRITDKSALWGIGLSASNDAATSRTTLGVGYTARWRWLLKNKQVEAARKAASVAYNTSRVVGRPGDPRARVRRLFEVLDAQPISLAPVPSLTCSASAFAPNSAVADQEVFAGHTFKGSLEWQYGSRLVAAATASVGSTRGGDAADTPLVGKRTAGLTVTTVIPQVFGASRYDDYYLAHGFQCGLGLGFTVSYSSCTEPDERLDRCPDDLLSDILFGGVIDLRVTSSLTPRFIIGHRSFKRVETDTDDADATLQFGFQLALSISRGG